MISLPVREWLHQEVVRTFAALLFICGLGAAYLWYKKSTERDINALLSDCSHTRNVVIPPPTTTDDTREDALPK